MASLRGAEMVARLPLKEFKIEVRRQCAHNKANVGFLLMPTIKASGTNQTSKVAFLFSTGHVISPVLKKRALEETIRQNNTGLVKLMLDQCGMVDDIYLFNKGVDGAFGFSALPRIYSTLALACAQHNPEIVEMCLKVGWRITAQAFKDPCPTIKSDGMDGVFMMFLSPKPIHVKHDRFYVEYDICQIVRLLHAVHDEKTNNAMLKFIYGNALKHNFRQVIACVHTLLALPPFEEISKPHPHLKALWNL